MKYRHSIIFYIISLCVITSAYAFDSFIINDIRIEGLRRISAGTVFNYLSVKAGDKLDADNSSTAITALFKTGLFKDVRLEREGNVLIVRVEERPAIAKITFVGNKDISTEDLNKALKGIGFAEGRVFNRSLLEKVEQELQRQYFNLGKYGVRIKSTVTPVEYNRVGIQFDISEGVIARIRQINIVGNQAFNTNDLLDEMELNTGGWFSFFTKSDQYSKQKLTADLETLRSYYLDRGYLNFSIDSSQVSITPDKKDVYITINLTEGDKYTVSEIKLVGNLIAPKEELLEKITIKPGQVFSRKELTTSTEAVTERISDEGYAFANINAVPEINAQQKTVALSFFVDPGKRVYVRRINFQGNTKTRDEVLRREMRQTEGGWVSSRDIKRSRTRLERLGYFDEVNVETPPVPNTNDQVDVNYTVVERPSGNIMAGVGYSQTQGVLFNASIRQDNFLGSGKLIGVDFNNSRVQTLYNLSYHNPYTDIHGVSRDMNAFYRTTDAANANLSRYVTDIYGTDITYGIPLTEFNGIYVGFGFDNTRLKTTDYSAREVHDFIKEHGDQYNAYRLTARWSRDTRNRALFPDEGLLQSFNAEVVLPFSDLRYYKVGYRQNWLYPVSKNYTLLIKGLAEYGKGYGNTKSLPFFANYFAGGPHSIRGFKENTLGPIDSNDLPLGGNLKVVGNAELILPIPFVKNVRSFRIAAFFDIGNVYGNGEKFDASLLRYSTGLSAIWMSPIGPLSFSIARPLNAKSGDHVQEFQFSIGTTF